MTDLPYPPPYQVRARTIRDFCRAYAVSRATAYRLIQAGKIESVKAGRRTLIVEETAERWLQDLRSSTEKPSAVTHGKTHVSV